MTRPTHLALGEEDSFSRRMFGRELGPPWDAVDLEADPDREWRSAAQDSPEQSYALWRQTVARSRALLAEALEGGGLDRPAAGSRPADRTPGLRRVLIDLIEEYARHVGHADLLRESIDGRVGEDPPQ
ncbi:DUF664 domain-containing protein [Streptomyces sp. NPDC052036]|uniref:mycothiol transferase n=1 Tax=unclassified Streptomyces TaxID=2593676 RepID=UPI00342AF3E9